MYIFIIIIIIIKIIIILLILLILFLLLYYIIFFILIYISKIPFYLFLFYLLVYLGNKKMNFWWENEKKTIGEGDLGWIFKRIKKFGGEVERGHQE